MKDRQDRIYIYFETGVCCVTTDPSSFSDGHGKGVAKVKCVYFNTGRK